MEQDHMWLSQLQVISLEENSLEKICLPPGELSVRDQGMGARENMTTHVNDVLL